MDESLARDGVALLLVVLWWLLRQRDAGQQKSIDLLFKKHDDDVDELQKLKLQIAKTHYDKPELDAKFDKLETAVTNGLKEISGKFDKLSEILVAHVTKEYR